MNLRENAEAAFQGSGDQGDYGAVVGEGDGLVGGGAHAVLDFAVVQHAAAAVDHHGIRGKVLWEFGAGAELEIQGLAGVLLEPVWQLYGADVVALAVVGTALGDENGVPVLKVFQGGNACYCSFQEAFVICHQDGKRSQGDGIGGDFPYHGKSLAVCDDHCRLISQPVQGCCKLMLPDYHCNCPGF